MVGIRLIIIMAIVGGFIAYLADKLGSKIGKKKMSVFGLRPKHTALLLTVASGVMISILSVLTVSISSESARTALFGMEKLQEELRSLNKEKDTARQSLDEAKKNVLAQNEIIELLDKDIKKSTEAKQAMEFQLKDIQGKYDLARQEVKNLDDSRKELAKEVKELEKTTESLRQGIANMREGQVYYRAGEVVYAAVLRGGMREEESKQQILWLLQNANDQALQRLGELKPEKPIQVIWISQDIVKETLDKLINNKQNYLCRLRTIANIIVGELVICEIEMIPNKLIYTNGEEIHKAEYNLADSKIEADELIMDFLAQVNRAAVEKGVIADPLTGKVGTLDAETMVLARNDIKSSSGSFKIIAYAVGDVTTAGPVRIMLKVKQ